MVTIGKRIAFTTALLLCLTACGAPAPAAPAAPAPVDNSTKQCAAFRAESRSSGLSDLFVGWGAGSPTHAEVATLFRILPAVDPIDGLDGFNDAVKAARASTTRTSSNSADVHALAIYWAAIITECAAK